MFILNYSDTLTRLLRISVPGYTRMKNWPLRLLWLASPCPSASLITLCGDARLSMLIKGMRALASTVYGFGSVFSR